VKDENTCFQVIHPEFLVQPSRIRLCGIYPEGDIYGSTISSNDFGGS
jgi:hypothetical protein